MRILDVRPVTLEGRFVRLEPLSAFHAADLANNLDPAIHRWFGGAAVPASIDEQGVQQYVETRLRSPNAIQFAVILKATNQAVGCTSYMDIRPAALGLEIGATWYGRAFHGTAVNPESKLLLLRHAFEELKCIRVQLKTDARNLQSRAAIEKLGAKFEGLLRAHRFRPPDDVGDTAMYSILPSEWPLVRQSLEERIAAFG